MKWFIPYLPILAINAWQVIQMLINQNLQRRILELEKKQRGGK